MKLDNTVLSLRVSTTNQHCTKELSVEYNRSWWRRWLGLAGPIRTFELIGNSWIDTDTNKPVDLENDHQLAKVFKYFMEH